MNETKYDEQIRLLNLFELSIMTGYECEAELSRISWEEKYDALQTNYEYRETLRKKQEEILTSYPELVEVFEKLQAESKETLIKFVFHPDKFPPPKRIKIENV